MNLLSLKAHFAELKSKLPPAEASVRELAFEHFFKAGLPNRKDENWKYTSMKAIESMDLSFSESNLSLEIKDEIKSFLNPDFYHLVFYNGSFKEDLSTRIDGLKVSQAVLPQRPFEDSLMSLNWALTATPLKIEIRPGSKIEKPLQMLFYHSSDRLSLYLPHLEVTVGSGSQVSMIEQHVGSAEGFVNSYVGIKALAGCRLTYVHSQQLGELATHVSRNDYQIMASAHVESLAFSTGAQLSRHSQKFSLKEPQAYLRSLGLYIATGNQHMDHTGLIDHEVGACTSYQIYKGLLNDQSRAIFNGQVLIRKEAQKAFSEQSNKNLLLSSAAEVDSKPQLEIFADDVQARHGSTVGQINQEELFYLNSRAISTEKALPLLSFGFLSDVLYQLSDERVSVWLKSQLQSALPRVWRRHEP